AMEHDPATRVAVSSIPGRYPIATRPHGRCPDRHTGSCPDRHVWRARDSSTVGVDFSCRMTRCGNSESMHLAPLVVSTVAAQLGLSKSGVRLLDPVLRPIRDSVGRRLYDPERVSKVAAERERTRR